MTRAPTLPLFVICLALACRADEARPDESAGGAGTGGDGTADGVDPTGMGDGSDASTADTGGGSTGEAEDDDGSESTSDGGSSDSTAGSDDGWNETGNPDAPGPVEELSASPADGAVLLEWQAPTDPDYAGIVLLRRADRAVAEGPTDGVELEIGDSLGEAEVIFVGAAEQRLDIPLVNGTTYHYRVYAFDDDTNYSVGEPVDATPRLALPGGMSDTDIDLPIYIDDARAVRAADGTVHVAAIGSATSGGSEIHYAHCDAPCTSISDWSSVLVDEDASDITPAISLDGDGVPWLTYRAWDPDDGTLVRAATCVAGCDATINWTVVPIAGNGGGGGARVLINHDPDGGALIVTNEPLVVHACPDTCTVPGNWTHETIEGSWHALGELVVDSSGRMTLTSTLWTGTGYQGRHHACDSGCTTADDWTQESQWGLGGNSGPLPQILFGPGESMWSLSVSSGMISTCDDCFPDLPGPLFYLPDIDAAGTRMRVTPWGQPRVVGASAGQRSYLACDYACDDPQNWSDMPLQGQPNEVVLDAWLDDDELPVIVYRGYGGLRLAQPT